MDTLKIKAIKTDAGYYCQQDFNRSSYDSHCLQNHYFDGVKAENTFNKSWARITKIPKIVEIEQPQSPINWRFELIDKTLESAKFPLVLKREDVTHYDDENGIVWNENVAHLKSLYAEKYDARPNIKVPASFEFNICLEIDKIKEYAGLNYPIQRTRWASEGFIPLTSNDVLHEEIDTILFPDIVLPARTSKLTSHQTYKIIRKHIQDNINPKYAKITSDYDFCFDVAKKIQLTKKEPYQSCTNVFRKKNAKAKYETFYREDRDIKIFSMTHGGDGGNYKGYEPIAPFIGKDIEDLKNNIDTYLSELMDKINEPVVDCDKCCGRGVLIK